VPGFEPLYEGTAAGLADALGDETAERELSRGASLAGTVPLAELACAAAP
jgi:hypothetical protein